jgi:transcriptional regulator with XRE-family HTH domain
MDKLGLNQAQLAVQVDANPASVSRWLKGEVSPDLAGLRFVRSTAEAFGVPLLEVMLAAEVLTEDELGVVRVAPDPDLLTDDELLQQLDKRMRQRRTEVIAPVASSVHTLSRVVNRSSPRP